MKQFFVFIYSKFSQPSRNCESIIHSLSSEISFNFLCIDNADNRKIIQNDLTLDIRLVPCLLIVNTSDNKITKYEGKKCHDYLIQFQKQQTPIAIPQPISMYQQEQESNSLKIVQPQIVQPMIQTENKVQQQNKLQTQAQQQSQNKVQRQHNNLISEEDSFNNPPDTNQTSSIILSENDDDEDGLEQFKPPIKFPKQQQNNKGKPSLLAQATAMQKSRLLDEERKK